MFERFTESARHVVVRAQEQARTLGHRSIGTEHLLLGVLIADPELARALAPHGVTEAAVVAQLEPGEGAEHQGSVPFTGHARDALELALRESLAEQTPYITPGHILIALTRQDAGGAARILRALGVDPEAVRTPGAPAGLLPGRSFVEELTLALRRAEQAARAAGRPVDTGDLLLGLAGSPVGGDVIRSRGLEEAVAEARAKRERLAELRRERHAAFESGEIARAEELRAEARRLRDELEGRS